jgi:hypothetical protein
LVYEEPYASVSRDGATIHLECAPKLDAERAERPWGTRDFYVEDPDGQSSSRRSLIAHAQPTAVRPAEPRSEARLRVVPISAGRAAIDMPVRSVRARWKVRRRPSRFSYGPVSALMRSSRAASTLPRHGPEKGRVVDQFF